MPDRVLTVVKVGGSLYDLPDLGPRLNRWLHECVGPEFVVIPGGGPAADVVRDLDRTHGLGEAVSHWLALRALALNAHFLAALLPAGCVVSQPEECHALWKTNCTPVLDVHAFAVGDEANADHLPHRWEATSDSFAARIARMAGAGRLVLLKSITLPEGTTWEEAAARGFVDALFAQQVRQVPALGVKWVNLRDGREEPSA